VESVTIDSPLSRSATNEYHGVKVTDPFRWLEETTNTAVIEWTDAQNKQARSYLDNLLVRPLIEDRLARLLTNTSPNYFSLSWRRGLTFMLKFAPPAQQPVLVTLGSLTNLKSERVVLDRTS
jgi:prolyl oligopeptidase